MASKKIKGLVVEFDGDISKLKKAMLGVTETVRQNDQVLKNLNKGLKLDPKNTELLTNKQELLKKSISDSRDALKKLQNLQQKLDSKNVDKLSKEYTSLQEQIAKTSSSIKKMGVELANLEFNEKTKNIQGMANSLDEVAKMTEKLSKISLGGAFGMGLIASQYESDVASIKKIVRDLKVETVEDLKEIAVATSTTFTNIAQYASVASALGVAQENLDEFAQTMRELETVTDGAIYGEEGAKKVARFLNVMGISTDYVHNFGSSLTIVEDKLAVTADEVLEISSRLGALSAVGNVTQHDIVALGSVMMNQGLRIESSGSAITRVFLDVEQQVAQSTEKMEEYAKVSGMTAEAFSTMWDTNPMEAFLRFTDGLKSSIFSEMAVAVNEDSEALKGFAETMNLTTDTFKKLWSQDSNKVFNDYIASLENLDDASESTAIILNNLGLDGIRTAETLLKLAGNGDLVREMIEISNKAWKENTELTEKANIVYETTKGRIMATVEALKQSAESIGKFLLPSVKDTAEGIQKLAEWLNGLPDGVKNAVAQLLVFGAVLSPISKGASKFLKSGLDIAKGIKLIGKAVDKNASGLVKFSRAFGTMVVNANPLVVATTAVSALGVAVYTMTDNTKDAKKAFNTMTSATAKWNSELEKSLSIARENYAQSQFELMRGDKTVQQLNELIAKREQLAAQGLETTEVDKQIQNGLQIINSLLGEQGYYYDVALGKIVDEQGKVIDLTEQYATLAREKQRGAWIEANTQAYYDALEANKALQDAQTETMKQYQSFYNGLSANYKQLVDEYLSGELTTAEVNLINDDELTKILSQVDMLKGAMQNATSDINENLNFIDLFDQASTLPLDDFLQKTKEFQQGIIVPQTALDSLSAYDKQLQDISARIETERQKGLLGGIVDTALIDSLQVQYTRLQEERNALQADIDARTQMTTQGATDMAVSVVDTITTTFTEGVKTGVTDPIENATKEGINIAQAMLNAWQLPRKTMYVDVQYNAPSFSPVQAPRTRSVDDRMAFAQEPSYSYDTYMTRVTPFDVGGKMQQIVDNINSTLTRSENNFDIEALMVKALSNMTVEVNVNNDMDGRQIASQVSTIQGLKIKKQNA